MPKRKSVTIQRHSHELTKYLILTRDSVLGNSKERAMVEEWKWYRERIKHAGRDGFGGARDGPDLIEIQWYQFRGFPPSPGDHFARKINQTPIR